MREQVIFMFWRAWHLRNDLIFGKGKETISTSVSFIQNYWGSFSSYHTNRKMEDTNKGKERVDGFYDTIEVKEKVVNWQPPDPESIKINVDASFVEAIRSASVGVVARNHLGEVIILHGIILGFAIAWMKRNLERPSQGFTSVLLYTSPSS